MGLSSFKFVQCSMLQSPQGASFFATECLLAIQGHPRLMILVPIESTYHMRLPISPS